MMIDIIETAPACPPAFMLSSVRVLRDRLAMEPTQGRAAKKLRKAAARLDRALSRAVEKYCDGAALGAVVPEMVRQIQVLAQRSADAGVPCSNWLRSALPEPMGADMRLTPAALMLVGVARLRALTERGPLTPRRARQLKALLAGEEILRRIVAIETAGGSVPVALIEEADAASWAIEDEIGGDLDDIFAENRRAPAATVAATA
jgi:hypothetical protein